MELRSRRLALKLRAFCRRLNRESRALAGRRPADLFERVHDRGVVRASAQPRRQTVVGGGVCELGYRVVRILATHPSLSIVDTMFF